MNLPAPVPLDPPPGDPSALADLVSAVTGAAFATGVLTAHLAGPAASAPGWLGADAAAAAEQVGAVAGLVQQLHGRLTAAEQRLRVHAEVLDDARQRVAALRRDQAEDFAVTWTHVAQADPDAARPAIAELEAAETDRRRAHAAAVADVLDDAAATAQVLDAATTDLGGTGTPGQESTVLAHVATLLPGWGDQQLVAEAITAADRVAGEGAGDFAAWLRSAGPLLDSPVFATAFLQALGGGGVELVLYWTASGEESDVAGPLARAMRAASRSDAGRRVVSQVVDAALGPPDAGATVALGRLAAAGAFDAATLGGLAVRLVRAEQTVPNVRRDQLAVAAGDDPLDSVLKALVRSGDADQAALLVGEPELWPTLLGRVWSVDLDGLTGVLRLAADGAAADAATLVVLQAIGHASDAILTQLVTGSPEAFSVASISAAVGELVAARPDAVTGVVLAGLGAPGAPSRPLEDPERLAMVGLGVVGLHPDARLSLLRWLTDATVTAPLPAPGEPDTAAYLEGGVFAVLAGGEAFENRHQLLSAIQRQTTEENSWAAMTSPLSLLPARLVVSLAIDAVTTGAEDLFGPDGVPWESFLRQPATGPYQAAYAAVVARAPSLVADGVLPDPGTALDRGIGSPEARAYEATLSPTEHAAWNNVVWAAEDGFIDMGGELGIMPGSG